MTPPIYQLKRADRSTVEIDTNFIQVGHLSGRVVRKILNDELGFLQSRLPLEESKKPLILNEKDISCSTETRYLSQIIQKIKSCLEEIEDSTNQILQPGDFEFLAILYELIESNLFEEKAFKAIIHSLSLQQLRILNVSDKIADIWRSIIKPLLNDNQRLTLGFLQGDPPLYQMETSEQIKAVVKAITYYLNNEKETFPLIKGAIENLTTILKLTDISNSEAAAALKTLNTEIQGLNTP